MTLLAIGIVLLGAVLGLFYLKDRLGSPKLARIAHSELNMRFAVIALALIVLGIMMIVGDLFR